VERRQKRPSMPWVAISMTAGAAYAIVALVHAPGIAYVIVAIVAGLCYSLVGMYARRRRD
jgi:Flp pilus assembly protein TadB